jgi:uncharacterized protein with ParB-like and HNH nuclease domain
MEAAGCKESNLFLIKDYPTGTMLTWETNNPPELKGSHKYVESQGAIKLILDGQQRITTLYMLMTGNIPPYYSEKEIENDIRNLYVNVETLDIEYYKKTIMENSPLWVNITEIFRATPVTEISRMSLRREIMVKDFQEKGGSHL